MKSFVFAFALVAVCSGEDVYTSDKDLDIKAVTEDVATLQTFVDCFTDKIECNAQTAGFKKDMPEAILQACAKCTAVQKHNVKLFFEALKEKLPAQYEELKHKFDPGNELFQKLEAAVAN